jgi:sugar lactone lactonase YvrE
MTIDANGHMWVAIYGAGEVRCYSLVGLLEVVVNVPVACPTSVAFGGDDLQDLYITTMVSEGFRDRPEPLAGALFRCRPGVTGRPCHVFAG